MCVFIYPFLVGWKEGDVVLSHFPFIYCRVYSVMWCALLRGLTFTTMDMQYGYAIRVKVLISKRHCFYPPSPKRQFDA